MNPSDYRPKNRRYNENAEAEGAGLRMLRYSGIPFFYVVGVCANIIGMICMGIITDYWANIENPTCFLYSSTASNNLFYKFGSSLTTCYWVTYGALPPTIIALVCGIFYLVGVFGDARDEYENDTKTRNSMVIAVAMIIASLMLLAVCCTLAEGMRVTCTNMGLNAVNGKADDCMDKINLRVALNTLPVKTSTMISSASAGLWIGMACFFALDICHLGSIYRKM